MSDQVHAISKKDNSKHVVYNIPPTSESPVANSVRVKSHIISLSSNNMTYARMGDILNWWDAYPVPENSPAPYNNREEWGIVPAWGYARILESTINELVPDSLLWGFWPASSHAIDLQLEANQDHPGQWFERSSARASLMTIYNVYQSISATDTNTKPENMHLPALCKAVWRASTVLNSYIFAVEHIHPLGIDAPWSEADASLTKAVVISLSASSKTARGFHWQLARNRNIESDGPLALLQFSSAPETLAIFPTSALPVKSVAYNRIKDATVSVISEFQPSRVVIFDFGTPESVLTSTLATLSEASPSTPVTVVAIGSEAKVFTPEQLQALFNSPVPKVRLNTSGVRDLAIKATGSVEFERRIDESWDRCMADKTFENLKVKVFRGAEGINESWSDLCDRKVQPNVGVIIEL